MTRFHARSVCLLLLVLGSWPPAAAAQPLPFEHVVRNLAHSDPEIRISAVRLLQEARYPEAAVPLAALANDPVDAIQLEAILAELSIFLVEPQPVRPRPVPFVHVGVDGRGPEAFAMGPLAAWPWSAPAEVVSALLQALGDQNGRVRVEAIYTLGVIARPPLDDDMAKQLTAALEHPDPLVRAGAARVVGRLGVASASDALCLAVNDANAEVRLAAMQALGELGDVRAVPSLTEQYTYYGRGAGAATALSALARIAHPSSIGLFKAQLTSRDPAVRRAAVEGLGRAGAASERERLQVEFTMDEADTVRTAAAFALVKLGQTYTARLLDFLEHDATARQAQAYLIELGPAMVPDLVTRLLEPLPTTRRYLVEVLGIIGGPQTLGALEPLTKDEDRMVAAAAARAVERIKLSQ